MRVAARVPSDQQLCFEHKFHWVFRMKPVGGFTARNSLRKKRRYWRYCRPDDSCQRQSLGLQPASPHIPRCPDRYHRCTSIRESWTSELLYETVFNWSRGNLCIGTEVASF